MLPSLIEFVITPRIGEIVIMTS